MATKFPSEPRVMVIHEDLYNGGIAVRVQSADAHVLPAIEVRIFDPNRKAFDAAAELRQIADRLPEYLAQFTSDIEEQSKRMQAVYDAIFAALGSLPPAEAGEVVAALHRIPASEYYDIPA